MTLPTLSMFDSHLLLSILSMLYKQQLLNNSKKTILSAHRWAYVNHTFSTSIHIDFFFSSLELMNCQELMRTVE